MHQTQRNDNNNYNKDKTNNINIEFKLIVDKWSCKLIIKVGGCAWGGVGGAI